MLHSQRTNQKPYNLVYQLNLSKVYSDTPEKYPELLMEAKDGWINVYQKESYDTYFQKIVDGKGEVS